MTTVGQFQVGSFVRRVAAGVAVALAALALGRWYGGAPAAPDFDQDALALRASDRVMVLSPHPDDETLACGGVIEECVAKGVPVRIVFFTYGDDNELSFLVYRKRPVLEAASVRRMGLVRHDEAVAAAGVLGMAPTNLVFLGYPDFGTFRIWCAHWGARTPLSGLLTRARKVPYASAYRPGAAYKGEEVLADLTHVIRDFRPTKIFVSHPADHNTDHQALYLFTRVALWNLEGELAPQLLPYIVHYRGWPHPRGYHPDLALEPPAPLARAIGWRALALSPDSLARKRQALLCHRSQCEYSRRYLFSFLRANELFGDFPAVPPNAGTNEIRDAFAVTEPPPDLTEEERSSFVGVASRRLRQEGSDLVIDLELSKPLGRAVEASVYVFGYRTDRPFETLPKLCVRLGETGAVVEDQGARIDPDIVPVSRDARRITICIPLEALGHPQRVLTGVHTYVGPVPLDWVPWRVFNVREPQRAG